VEIGPRIRKLRREARLSMEKLAGLVGISQPYLSQIERGDRQCPLDVLDRICETLGLTLREFFSQGNEPIPLPAHLRPLLERAKDLTPEQVDLLTRFLATMKRK